MNRFFLTLSLVAVVGLVAYPVSVAVTDTTPAQFEYDAEDIKTVPAQDAAWYEVGLMPVAIVVVTVVFPLAILVIALMPYLPIGGDQ